MKIRVRLFSVAKDIAGFDDRIFEIKEHADAATVLEEILKNHPGLEEWKSSIRMAVNLEYVPLSHGLKDGDEVAIVPPVSGG